MKDTLNKASTSVLKNIGRVLSVPLLIKKVAFIVATLFTIGISLMFTYTTESGDFNWFSLYVLLPLIYCLVQLTSVMSGLSFVATIKDPESFQKHIDQVAALARDIGSLKDEIPTDVSDIKSMQNLKPVFSSVIDKKDSLEESYSDLLEFVEGGMDCISNLSPFSYAVFTGLSGINVIILYATSI